jgi:DNA polymerase (family 10)
MTIANLRIAEVLDQLADLLDIEGANPFRVRAYRNAARTVAGLSESLAGKLAAGEDLAALPGIGQDLAGKIATLVETGRLPLLEEVGARTPATLAGLMKVPGLGPKRVKTLYRALGIRSAEDLQRALRAGKVRELRGFGRKSEEAIAAGLSRLARTDQRTLRLQAEQVVAPLVQYLRAVEGVRRVEVAGSLRRRRETVGDLDVLVTCQSGSPVMARFIAYDDVEQVVSQGETRSTVIFASGLQVDLRVVPAASLGAALQYFTGSKAHNIAVRRRAQERGLKVNEYGVFRDGRRVAGPTEEAVYAALGLPYIEPELREDRGEIKAALEGRLPRLIALEDLRGDLHCHTTATDGRDSLEQMAGAARERGYEYLAVTDHSRHVTVAHGLDPKRLREQLAAIDRLNERLEGLVLLKSVELDILKDGTLDLPDDVLDELDLTVCSVHYAFDLPRDRQTERILRAMDNPHFNVLAHPTGRLLNERPPYEVDLERVLQGAKERGCFLEVNSQPMRLDLTDTACQRARELGVKVVVSTDAHSTAQLDYLRLGVDQARRGWLTADDVLNTRPLGELRRLLNRR